MKIGFLCSCYFSNIGGIESHILFMARELKKAGHEVLIFNIVNEDDLSKNSDNEILKEVEIRKIFFRKNFFVRIIEFIKRNSYFSFIAGFLLKAQYILNYREIGKEILKEGCDIIHQHDFIANLFTTKYLNSKSVFCCMTNHTGEYLFLNKFFIGRYFLKFLLSHFKFIIGPSTELTPYKYCKDVFTIFNGVDDNIFNTDYDKYELRKKLNFSKDDFIIFCPRRWAPTKGVIYLMDAISKGQFNSCFKFLFAGNDHGKYKEYENKIHNIYDKISEKENIFLLGNISVDKIHEYYKISDITVIPSLMEAVSLSALESMACGTPVIASDVGGLPELIEDKKNGILVEKQNVSDIIKSINLLFDNNELYDNLRLNGIKTSEKHLWSNIADQVLIIYKEFIYD